MLDFSVHEKTGFIFYRNKKTAPITGCCKFSCAVFFLAFFMHIKIEITNTQQRKE